MSSTPQITFALSRQNDVQLTAKNDAAVDLLGSSYPVDFTSSAFDLDLLFNKVRIAGGEFFDASGRRYDAYDARREIDDELAVLHEDQATVHFDFDEDD